MSGSPCRRRRLNHSEGFLAAPDVSLIVYLVPEARGPRANRPDSWGPGQATGRRPPGLQLRICSPPVGRAVAGNAGRADQGLRASGPQGDRRRPHKQYHKKGNSEKGHRDTYERSPPPGRKQLIITGFMISKRGYSSR